MNDFDRAVDALREQERRRVTRISTEPLSGTVRITLGCGHTFQIRVGLPGFTVIDIYGVELGDEMSCPHCLNLATFYGEKSDEGATAGSKGILPGVYLGKFDLTGE